MGHPCSRKGVINIVAKFVKMNDIKTLLMIFRDMIGYILLCYKKMRKDARDPEFVDFFLYGVCKNSEIN